MSRPSIEVENLSKLYRLGLIGATTLRESVQRWWYRWRGKGEVFKKKRMHYLMIAPDDPQAGPEPDTIWALKDVSFTVNPGEIIGIIGRNGAGKSTLLKILSRITEPTEGRAIVRGRSASLLEVGTGFHPELTGRENIYLNGAILGMRKREIDKKFEEIVSFAEVEKFIDTPLKHYSSGMYVRLAFSVAAYLEAEILFVDEVLAVGDMQFQRKCLGKMNSVAKEEGRTILFVSHNMAAINRLCHRAMWLDRGYIFMQDKVKAVIESYLSEGSRDKGEVIWKEDVALEEKEIYLIAVRIRNYKGEISNTLDTLNPFYIEIEYRVTKDLPPMRIVLHLASIDGTIVFLSPDNYQTEWEEKRRPPGRYVSICEIPAGLLNVNHYTISISAELPFVKLFFLKENILTFTIQRTGGVGAQYTENWPGIICPTLRWKILKDTSKCYE